MPTKQATRTYRDLKGRTTQKSRVHRSDRIPGDQFDADRALDEGYLNIEEGADFDVAEEVDPSEVEIVTEQIPPRADEPEMPGEELPPPEEGYQETSEEEQEEMPYEEGMEVKEEDIEEAYYGDEKPKELYEEPEKEVEEACGSPMKEDAAMLKRSEGSFADRLRMAMEPAEEELVGELGEEVALEEPMPTEGPCPAGCEPVTTEETPPEGAEDEGILEVGEDEVTFLEEEPKEAASEEVTADSEDVTPEEVITEPIPEPEEPTEEVTADVEETYAAEEALYETLGNIETLADVSAENVDLFRTNEETENPQYVVMVDGDPVAKVAFEDQPEGVLSEMFTDDDYPQYVLENMQSFGVKETLQHVHARYYVASAMSGEVAQQMRTAAVEDMQVEHKQRLAEMKDQLINVANIVVEGSLKNYITDNPLRDALVQGMQTVNVDENAALDIVEAAFRQKGSDFFRAIIKKAEEWMGAPQEVLEHHVKEISQMDYRHPGYVREIPEEIPEEQVVAHIEQVPASVPLRTVASASPAPRPQAQAGQWDKEAIKRELNLHQNLVQKSLTNRGGPR